MFPLHVELVVAFWGFSSFPMFVLSTIANLNSKMFRWEIRVQQRLQYTFVKHLQSLFLWLQKLQIL